MPLVCRQYPGVLGGQAQLRVQKNGHDGVAAPSSQYF